MHVTTKSPSALKTQPDSSRSSVSCVFFNPRRMTDAIILKTAGQKINNPVNDRHQFPIRPSKILKRTRSVRAILDPNLHNIIIQSLICVHLGWAIHLS